MQVKNELRKKYKEIRKNVENRNEKNTLINDFLCNSDCFKNCDTVLFYAALSDEVNLDFSIKYAIDNKLHFLFVLTIMVKCNIIT